MAVPKKIGKNYILCMTLLFVAIRSVFANEFKVTVQPSSPVKGEVFYLDFEIQVKNSIDPYISFNPGSIEVIGRSEGGVNIQTTMINGKFSVKRTLTKRYEMVSSRSGSFTIKDINMDIDGNKIKHKNIQVRVLNQRAKAKNIFLRAEVNKEVAYIGEGIDLRYYLYYRVPKVAHEIKSFPKLNKFIKRFHHNPRAVEETVEFSGNVYRKALMYSARIYPEVEGKAYVDPMRIQAQYQETRGGQNGFGMFGFNLGRIKSGVLSSQKIEITVLPIPSENIPPTFTGLVGKHEFSLEVPRNKFLVNEAVELRLTVKGEGALEKFSGPNILTESAFEEFDTKAELTETDKSNAQKVFDYTYLARGPIEMDGKKINISYFDPELKEFKTTTLEIPGVIVSGVAQSSIKNNEIQNSSSRNSVDTSFPKVNNQIKAVALAPIFEGVVFKKFSIVWIINILFSIIILVILFEIIFKRILLSTGKSEFDKLEREIFKSGITYSKMFKLVHLIEGSNKSLSEKLDVLPISSKSKKYFKEIVIELEKATYSQDEKKRVRVKKKYFLELRKVLKNENYQVS